ncbi:MAG: diguanylate cyclase [Lachnospiraceae bacterium]|nr:diguanylate cyclase [Lachnospiraceae bacterium]
MTSEEKNCELLFQYLKGILYDPEVKPIDLEALDEPYQHLGAGLLFLEKAVKEMLQYSEELSKGNLSGPSPSKDNFLCKNLKNLNANLNHLAWQAKQVAAGDYSQHVSYLGEFSEAFNTMTGQLKERERLLKEETRKALEHGEVIRQYNDLLMELTRKRREWILVVDAETKEIVYCNKREDNEHTDPNCCEHRLSFREKLLNWSEKEQKSWEADDDNGRNYQISTFFVVWRNRNSYAHIVLDVTEQEQRTRKLRMKAYQDPGTGIRNRLYFEERMAEILASEENAILCYMDLDGLKTVNDQFGHLEGDEYIRSFVSIIEQNFRSSDEFARIGGDEFALILFNCGRELALQKLAETLDSFTINNDKNYLSSFSYGIVEIDSDSRRKSLEEIIRLADEEMYICKRAHKAKLKTSPQ